jgi:adsorption protein B
VLKTFPNACIEGLGWIAAGVNVVIFISCVDDAFIDAYYWIRELYRALTVRRKYPPLRTAALKEKPEQPLAIMIPAWREFSVISDMVEAAISALD